MSKTEETPVHRLPEGFLPGDHDVVIGKGKKFYFHEGNQWLRSLVAKLFDDYKEALTKSEKSNIISEVVGFIYQNGRFVKRCQESGQWVLAEPLLCREKVSQSFRDNMAETYKSSNVAKRNKRRHEQLEKRQQQAHVSASNKRLRLATDSLVPPSTFSSRMQELPAFDLEMPLASPKPHKTQTNSVFGNTLDINALTNLLMGAPDKNSTGTTDGDRIVGSSHQGSGLDFSAFTALFNTNNNGCSSNNANNMNHGNMNMNLADSSNIVGSAGNEGYRSYATAASRRSSLNLLSTFSDLFDDNCNGNNNVATACPFEPTPLMTNHQDTMQHQQQPSSDTMDSLWEQLSNMPLLVYEQQPQSNHHHTDSLMMQKQTNCNAMEDALAPFTDADWLKLGGGGAHEDSAAGCYSSKVSAAFAA